MTAAAAYTPPTTLRDYNQLTATLGVAPATRAAFDAAIKNNGIDRFRSVLQTAVTARNPSHRTGAIAYLRRVAAGEFLPPDADARAQALPPHPEADSRRDQHASDRAPRPSTTRTAPATSSARPAAPRTAPARRDERAPDHDPCPNLSALMDAGAAPREDDDDTAPAAPAASERAFDQVTVYGLDTALQIERCPSKKNRQVNTINLVIAKATGRRTTEGINWKGRFIVMLTAHEIQLIAAVLLGVLPKVRFAGHGKGNDKWFIVEESEKEYAGAVRFSITQGKETRMVNVGATDIAAVLGKFLATVQEQLGVDGALVIPAVRRATDLYVKGLAAREARKGGA